MEGVTFLPQKITKCPNGRALKWRHKRLHLNCSKTKNIQPKFSRLMKLLQSGLLPTYNLETCLFILLCDINL